MYFQCLFRSIIKILELWTLRKWVEKQKREVDVVAIAVKKTTLK